MGQWDSLRTDTGLWGRMYGGGMLDVLLHLLSNNNYIMGVCCFAIPPKRLSYSSGKNNVTIVNMVDPWLCPFFFSVEFWLHQQVGFCTFLGLGQERQ